MSMESTDEPSKWVCRLQSYFDTGPFCGTGFVVNIPETKKLCILTAGHNIVRKGAGSLDKIRVAFPNELIVDVNSEECFASSIYKEDATIDSNNENSFWDYGLIVIDAVKRKIDKSQLPGGCAFSVWQSKNELLANQVTVHGYREGEPRQTKGTSSLDRVSAYALYYYIDTIGGVSGGPVFSLDEDGNYVAVAIHNYHSQGTRLTVRVMFEILSWIDDYPLQRTVQARPKSPPLYLQATKGSRPNIVTRPTPAKLNFVVVDAPKSDAERAKPHYSILPASAAQYLPLRDLSFYMLAVDEIQLLVSFEKLATPCHSHVISILRKKTLLLPNSKFPLTVFSSTRNKSCGCGCITQDQKVGLKEGPGTSFFL